MRFILFPVAAVYDRRTYHSVILSLSKDQTRVVRGKARIDINRPPIQNSVILSLSKDQPPESDHRFVNVWTYRKLILRQAQDDRLFKQTY
jgi:hypothetical protein